MSRKKTVNPFPFSDTNKRYHTYDYYLRQRFGAKVSRVSLNAGFTCPTLDGTRGRAGCSFCSPAGSGEFGGDPSLDISAQFAQVAARMGSKWDTGLHIAYFQARTNTYAPVDTLRRLYEQALACPGVVGLAISTRPDCLPDDVCALLAELAQRTYLTVELGLQTVHDETARAIGRGHTFAEFEQGVQRLHALGVSVGAHIIDGLPGETHAMMLQTARTLATLPLHFLKIHLLYVAQGTRLAAQWRAGAFETLTLEQYVQIVCDQLEQLPPELVIGRLTGDGAPDDLLAPDWSRKKLCVLNEIDKELARRNSWQGRLCPPLRGVR